MPTSVTEIPTHIKDDFLTVCAVSLISAALADVLHEGVGHALLALSTGTQSGVISTVAWSSGYDSRLVAAGGTLVNLAAGLICWLVLRGSKKLLGANPLFSAYKSCLQRVYRHRVFLFFRRVQFRRLAGRDRSHASILDVAHIAGCRWDCRLLLCHFAGGQRAGEIRRRPSDDPSRYRKLTFIPYISAALLLGAGGLLNPIGIQLVWESALPGAAGADCGLLWMRYYISKRTVPEWGSPIISRSYPWIIAAAVVSLAFIFVLGRGIPLHR